MYNKCLLKVPVFSSLDEKMLEEISKLIEPKQYKSGAVICLEDTLLPYLGVVHDGVLKIRKISEDGKEHILSILYPGDYFGEEGLLEEKRASFDIVCLKDVAICTISYTRIRELMEDNPSLTFAMMNSLLQKLGERNEAVFKRNLKNASQRVMEALEYFVNESRVVTLPISKKDFATSLGIAPETFSRILKKLVEDTIFNEIN